MLWVFVCIGVAFCGVAVLGVLAVRVFVEVQRLARRIGESSRRLTEAAEEFQRHTEPLAARAGEVARGVRK
ncbi:MULTISPECIES: hypothetical protein [Streptomycetaceae]|uniref:Secreted protein n=1 Tax=Streptantibioticus cattleyicolor (strain ATCC 35852 / DSM 46488 / JCM 4925 / NBRC 14057 / NRRL 8057) TaxID=1003195 RepID=F8K2N6_STREN|nr:MULTISPECIES: hypothetical protein [Streptomycetaceae]AEW97546.1 hypothetical protein SCATT_51750 [Streptantibioticus cattleyicolor NRRL 8057 = DSM 46488]MYS61980.1 hypothetical protein [Streptomyces sp. SID5468]CCB77871.1 putative small membrane protein [Streptantibioticus cattleyicolor NRRL 8057 = DSM 46488]